jgi:NADH dehydrogenase
MTGKVVAVFGASGFLGRHVVRELARRGWRIRAAVRRPHLAHDLRPLGSIGQIDLVQANIRYRPSIEEAIAGCDAVVNLVGILDEQGQQNFDAVQANGARNVAEVAAGAGIRNMVHVSAIGADANSESTYARTKAEGEAAVRDHVPEAVILRPSIIFGPQDDFFNRFAGMTRISPFLPAIGGGKTRFQPVYVDDVADCVAIALETPGLRGRTYELGGPEIMTFKELMQLMLRVIGRRRTLIPIPFAAAGVMGKAGDVAGFVPFVSAPITSDQVKLLKTDNVVGASGEDVDTIADFGVEPEPLEAILPTYLVRFRKHGQFSPETT